MSSLYARIAPVVPIKATADLRGSEHKFYKLDGSNQAIAIGAATDVPDGLIGQVRESDGLEISAIKSGGNHGTVKIIIGGTAVTDLRKDLQLNADGTVSPDDGNGPRVLVARPVEVGDAGEAIECILLKPRVFGAAVAALATADGSDAGTTQTLANATKAKLNAVIAALQTAGLLA